MRKTAFALAVLSLALLLAPVSEVTAKAPDDGRVAAVADLQGIATVRPVGCDRWTPLGPRSLIMPGDLVRTLLRGANAVELRFVSGASMTVGPNTLVEITEDAGARLLRGDIEVKGKASVAGPGGFTAGVTERMVLRAMGGETKVLEKDPRWLTGYRSSTTDEWMGSLVAQVDGRATPLSVGYHKVDVVIRDQIAMTTVEQSFVNSTHATLEGVFTFPLPADASISGFGMWIGDELVMADIVEKQRAREIYEDILRQRKDPGLLEWSGGNLFKARVFPIFGHSEKRVLIRYTQVLPLTGSAMSYRYALRSELLRHQPLRELRLKVSVHSALPIADVACVSHETRVNKTDHSAIVEYVAEEISPDRDFEVRVDLGRKPALAAIPHRRGEDGYFMLLLSPPDPGAGGWRRELTPEGGPLDVILLADTSGSMDSAQRENQADFVEAILSLLGEKDSFRLAATDHETVWWRSEAVPATERNAGDALAFLASRDSMGWSDFLSALGDARAAAGDATHVIYVGDGIGTTGDADPVKLANAIGKLGGAKATFHAAHTGSAYEKGVLDAIAGIGGGSVRDASAEPLRAAHRLLAEVAQPVVKDLRIEFSGIRTARVYPKRPPNLAAGKQHAILGRFLPTGGEQRGKVTVSGTLEGKPVRYSADIVVANDEAGNTFLPRLWARRHLDALLAQGASPEVKEEIVAFSEEFGIMTPFTSFLVLESDEQREQYGVARRVAMRDGERFFAAGKDRAATDVLQQQMRKARTWRIGLRRRVLAEIAGLGRDLVPPVGAVGWGDRSEAFFGHAAEAGVNGTLAPAGSELSGDGRLFEGEEFDDNDYEAGEDTPPGERTPQDPAAPAAEPSPVAADELMEESLRLESKKSVSYEYRSGKPRSGRRQRELQDTLGGLLRASGATTYGRPMRDAPQAWVAQQITNLFGWLPPAPGAQPERKRADFPQEVVDLLERLDTTDLLAGYEGGIESTQTTTSFHALRGVATRRAVQRVIVSPASWLTANESLDGNPVTNWTADGVRGVMDPSVRLGRKRPAADSDRLVTIPGLSNSWKSWLYYEGWSASVQQLPNGRTVLVLAAPRVAPPQVWVEYRLVVDPEKNVVTEQKILHADKVTSVTTYSDFAKVAGRWLALRAETVDAEGRRTWVSETRIEEIDAKAADGRIAAVLGDVDDILFLGPTDPEAGDAKQAVKDGKAGFPEHLVVMLDPVTRGEWGEAWRSWPPVAEAAGARPGLVWVRAQLLASSRRGEELQKLAMELAGKAVAAKNDAFAAALARRVHGIAASVFGPHELVTILERVAPAWRREGEYAEFSKRRWEGTLAQALWTAGRRDESAEIWERIFEADPTDQGAIYWLLTVYVEQGPEKLVAFLSKALESEKSWLQNEADQVYARAADLLWNARQYEAFAETVTRWIARGTMRQDAYQRYLTGLLYLDRSDEVEAWVKTRFAEGLPKDAGPADIARLGAAIQFALGNGWNFWTGRIAPRWVAPLGRLALSLMRNGGNVGHLAGLITGNWRFRRTDTYRELRAVLYADLRAEGALDSMSSQQLGRYVQLLAWERGQIDDETWATVVAALRSRWSESADEAERRMLAQHVLSLYDRRGEVESAVEFLRTRLREDPEEEHPAIASLLTLRLVQLPWTEEIEAELFRLVLLDVPKDAESSIRRERFASSARRLAENLYRMRRAAALGPAAEQEKLPRAELRLRQRKARDDTRKALAAVFLEAAGKAHEDLSPFYEIESLCFAVEAGEDPVGAEGRAREILLAAAPAAPDALDRMNRERASLVLAFASVRRGAPAEISDRTLALYRERLAAKSELLDWRYQVFRLLVALDRTDALTEALRSWIDKALVESRWRIVLGYLLAESGDIAKAASRFQEVAAAGELTERGYELLADFYLVLGDDAKRAKAQEERYRVVPEYTLRQRAQRHRQKVQRRGPGVPEDLDPEVFRVLPALMRKASHPANHLWTVRSLYETTKDFRVLECLADAVTGHTPEGVYPCLEQLAGLVGNVHEEATLDTISTRLAERAVETKAATDRRALSLLSALVERRAAMVLNQPGPHGKRALAALKAGFPDEWRPGEKLYMASFLASLGRIEDAALAEEQLRQLEAIHRLEAPATTAGLAIAWHLYRTHWGYGDGDRAIEGLTAALEVRRQAAGGALPQEALRYCETLISWLVSKKHFAEAEAWLVAERDRQTGLDRKAWYRVKIVWVYASCLNGGGRVSLGQGEELYRAARKLAIEEMFALPAGQVPSALASFLDMHRAAHKRLRLASAGPDLIAFGKTTLPEVLTRQPGNEGQLTLQTADTIWRIAGPVPALELLIVTIENEPDWRRDAGRGGWRSYGYRIAELRKKAGSRIGDLAPRVLAVALLELELELLSLEHQGHHLYHRNHNHFWGEKREDFATVARRVIEMHGDSPSTVLFAARYLWVGLGLKAEAVDALVKADERGKLVVEGRDQLVRWLHELRRWAESLPHAEKLVAGHPDVLDYRVLLVRSLHHVERDDDGRKMVDATVERFKSQGRWTENVISGLGAISLECGYFVRSVAFYEEVIPLRERRMRGRPRGQDGTLPYYYAALARAYSGLGRSDDSVRAASSAVVAWGPNQSGRQTALSALRVVLAEMKDLDAWIERYVAEAAETGMDAPVIRKSLGQVFLEKKAPGRALEHLLVAREISPADKEVHQLVVRACDAAKDAAAGMAAVRVFLLEYPKEYGLYQDLAARLDREQRKDEAERVRTGLAEAEPNEAEGHRRLAQARERQKRFGEAAEQWRQVVRIRTLEPDGWFALARALGRAGEKQEALHVLDQMLERTWDPRFGNVKAKVGQVRAGIER